MPPRKMTEKEILASIKKLFGRNREPLRKSLKKAFEAMQEYDKWWDIKKILHRKTGQAVATWCGLMEETFANIGRKNAKLDYIGDPSFRYEIVLNPDRVKGLDWDKKLAMECGGTVNICVVWINMLLPLYAMDFFSLSYSEKDEAYEYKPYKPKTAAEKEIVKTVKDELKARDLQMVSRKLASTQPGGAYTDLATDGEATVFQCLFSDLLGYQEEWLKVNEHELADPIKGVKVGWREHFNRRGKILKTEIYRTFPSGDQIKTVMDGKDRVVQVRVVPASGPGRDVSFILDVEEETRNLGKSRTSGKRAKKKASRKKPAEKTAKKKTAKKKTSKKKTSSKKPGKKKTAAKKK